MSVLPARPWRDSPALAAGPEGAVLGWLGQAGFLIALGGQIIVVDPYLSDSLAEKYRGTRFPHERMMPPPVAPSALRDVDWLLCTHGHTDHMDPGTIAPLLAASSGARVLAPRAERVRAIERGVPPDRLVLIDAGETVDLAPGVSATAMPAAHEQMTRTPEGHSFLGFVLRGRGVTIWHSGDTVPWPGQAEWLSPFRVDLALLPVNGRDALRAANGVPGNLTLEEAVALADAIGARAMLGHHFGLFDFNTLDPVDGRRRLAGLASRADAMLAETGVLWDLSPVPHDRLSILMVCRGNIYRSPLAAGMLAARSTCCHVESAAVMDWNRSGIRLSSHRARQVSAQDFNRFDLILGMDRESLAALQALRPPACRARLGLLGAYLEPGSMPDIEDPWGGDQLALEAVDDDIARATARLARLVGAATT
jgi:L-ascorbate metabolism protein UlaG (beta-lactamase superfamily)/protein-tyrosine-phosphatase